MPVDQPDLKNFRHRRMVMLDLLILLAITGCGTKPPKDIATYPVRGQILIGGKPMTGAEVRFKPRSPLKDPLKRSIEPYAFVDDDGTFVVSTYKTKDGAPLGEYAITVVWPKVTIEGGEEVFGPDRLNNRYSNPDRPVASYTVVDGSNLIPDINLND